MQDVRLNSTVQNSVRSAFEEGLKLLMWHDQAVIRMGGE